MAIDAAGTCGIHSDHPAVTRCGDCGRGMCRPCFDAAPFPWRVCAECTQRRRERVPTSVSPPAGTGSTHQQVLPAQSHIPETTGDEVRSPSLVAMVSAGALAAVALGAIGFLFSFAVLVMPFVVGAGTGFAAGLTVGWAPFRSGLGNFNLCRNVARSLGLVAFVLTFWSGYVLTGTAQVAPFDAYVQWRAEQPLSIRSIRGWSISSSSAVSAVGSRGDGPEAAAGMHYLLWGIEGLVALWGASWGWYRGLDMG